MTATMNRCRTRTLLLLSQDGDSLNNNSPFNTYVSAMVFSLGHPYGTPSILSSYQGFTHTDAGAPNGGVGTCSGSEGSNGWLCQHRWHAVAGMVGFRNNVGSAAITNWVLPQGSQIAFGRGTFHQLPSASVGLGLSDSKLGALGFVAINNADMDWSATFLTSLPDGSYRNVISGTSSEGICTGSSYVLPTDLTFAVSGTNFRAGSLSQAAHSLPQLAQGATGQMGSSSGNSGSVTVRFTETANTTFGEVRLHSL